MILIRNNNVPKLYYNIFATFHFRYQLLSADENADLVIIIKYKCMAQGVAV